MLAGGGGAIQQSDPYGGLAANEHSGLRRQPSCLEGGMFCLSVIDSVIMRKSDEVTSLFLQHHSVFFYSIIVYLML